MSLFQTLLSRHFYSLIKFQTPLRISTKTHKFLCLIQRTVTSSPQPKAPVESESENKEKRKPLHLLFKEAVGLSEKAESCEIECINENNELKRKLKELEQEVKRLKSNSTRKEFANKGEYKKNTHKSLSAVFKNQSDNGERRKEGKSEEVEVQKQLSPEMEVFVNHLYIKGYFENANFIPRNKFDPSCFSSSYGRDFIKFAAQRFGKDHQEIAEWMSGDDLKRVVVFGCPSLDNKCVFAAKRLRKFFEIQEAAQMRVKTVVQVCEL
ncbi:Craniofacial development protein 1, putative isoform 1 [Quillaja saponaria]|uniref:Craniofacial development protein 1, putative isoform 1 n=1 Tax=Quillaja saponaria TaxID=32244 RepID=A0AAD7VMT7_QUISA|nr:Craniofacial development protein 1, putative isoform 1 [Quillaja saponaria]